MEYTIQLEQLVKQIIIAGGGEKEKTYPFWWKMSNAVDIWQREEKKTRFIDGNRLRHDPSSHFLWRGTTCFFNHEAHD